MTGRSVRHVFRQKGGFAAVIVAVDVGGGIGAGEMSLQLSVLRKKNYEESVSMKQRKSSLFFSLLVSIDFLSHPPILQLLLHSIVFQ